MGRKEKIEQAERLYKSGNSLSEIAEKLGVTKRTVSNWKREEKWTDGGGKTGGRKGNQNAKGGKGNPNPNPPPDQTKHGAYSGVYWDTLSEKEKQMLEEMENDIELMLIEQARLCHVREHRIMEAVKQYKDKSREETDEMETIAIVNTIMRMEQELSTVQNRKTKVIETMAKINMEKKKEEQENSVGNAIDQWIKEVRKAEEAEKTEKEDGKEGQ